MDGTDNAALAAQQQQLKQQQLLVAQAQVAAAARMQQLSQPGLGQQHQLPPQLGSLPQQQQQQLQQMAMQQALQQQQQQMLMQQHQQQLAYQQAAQRQAQLAVQQRAAQLQAQLQYRPPQPGLAQAVPHQHAARPAQQPLVYPGAYGMMAAPRPVAAATQQPAPAAPQKPASELVLQLGRVKKIVKQASDVKAIANDANFAIARATELFIEAMAEKSAKRTLADQRILLAYSDVAATVNEWKALDFLADIVPRKIPASVLLRQLQEQQMQQQAKAAANGFAVAKPEPAVKSEGILPMEAEADGHADVKPEADGHAAVKAEADGHQNGQPPSAAMAEPVTRSPAAPSAAVSAVPGAAYEDGHEDAKVEQAAPGDMPPPAFAS